MWSHEPLKVLDGESERVKAGEGFDALWLGDEEDHMLRKWGLQSSNCMELNSDNNLN